MQLMGTPNGMHLLTLGLGEARCLLGSAVEVDGDVTGWMAGEKQDFAVELFGARGDEKINRN